MVVMVRFFRCVMTVRRIAVTRGPMFVVIMPLMSMLVPGAAVVGLVDRRAFSLNMKLRRPHACARHPLDPNGIGSNRQASQGAPHFAEGHAGIDERAEQHVAGGAGKAVEIENLHRRNILSAVYSVLFGSWPASSTEKYRWSPRIR